jgi:lincosamide nucleotidyltransferase B/F
VPERKAVSEHLIDERGNMLQQEVMIEKLRALCERDERVVAALMYGSFALTQGDRFSDIEFYLFFEEKALDGLEEGWLSQIAPLELYYINEFGNDTAIFENLVRDELHLEPYSKVVMVGAWETAWFPSLESAVLVDKTGELSRRVSRLVQRPPEVDTPERALLLCRSLMNWTLMGNNLLKRGSTPAPRRFDASPRPPPPGRAAGGGEERQLVEPVPTAGGGRLCGLLRKVQGVHSSLERGAVGSGVTSTWEWSQKLMCERATSHALVLPEVLLNKLDQHIEVDKVPKPNFREPAVEPMRLVRMNEEDARQR